jgi:hypothetical protein
MRLWGYGAFTPEQEIAIAVYRATLDVMRQQEAEQEAVAQRLRDMVDAGDFTDGHCQGVVEECGEVVCRCDHGHDGVCGFQA